MMAGNEAASAAPASSNNSQRPQVDGLSVLANEAASFYLYYPGVLSEPSGCLSIRTQPVKGCPS